MRRARWVLVLAMSCGLSPLALGCGEVATVDSVAPETTTTVVKVTTTSAATSWTLDPGAPEPMGAAALVGGWGRVEDGYDIVMTFEADGTFWWNCMAISPNDPPGDAVYGTWRANDTTVWVSGCASGSPCAYSIEDGVLRMCDPTGGDSTVFEWR